MTVLLHAISQRGCVARLWRMMALQLLFTAVVERPLRPRAPSAASVRAATPAERSSARSNFLFLFRGTHGDFRLSEVRSVAETLGVGPVSFRSAGAAGTLQASGGDVGPSVFQFVSLPDAEAAAAVARRGVLVRGGFEVWASAEAGDGDAWDALAVDVAAARRRPPPLACAARRRRGNVARRRAASGKQAVRQVADARVALRIFGGAVEHPGQVDRRSVARDLAPRGLRGRAARPAPRRAASGGRQLADGGGRRLNEFALSDRRTSRAPLPPTVAFLMANAAHRRWSSALDPFCSSASTLLAAAALGAAATVGYDLDPRHCAPPRDGQASIADNFAARGSRRHARARRRRRRPRGRGAAGGGRRRLRRDRDRPAMRRDEGLGSTYLPMQERHQLLQIAATRLRVGGRLVFLLVPAEAAFSPLPQLPRASRSSARRARGSRSRRGSAAGCSRSRRSASPPRPTSRRGTRRPPTPTSCRGRATRRSPPREPT